MTEPMTPEEARTLAGSFPGDWNHYELTRIKATLRVYAGQAEQIQAMRHAILSCIHRIERPELSPDASVVLEQARQALTRMEQT